MTRPQPLDLEDIERKILEEITGKRQYTFGIGDPEVIRTTLLEIKQRLKSAVEGLKNEIEDFKDKNPSLDTWVYSEILRMIDKWFRDVIEEEE